MIKDNELHIVCNCHSHELHIERDDLDFPKYPMWYGSYWTRGYAKGTPWRFKLNQIWRILKNGTPYGDEVVLERKDMEELLTYVQQQLEATKDKA